jgi:Holliday junction resolvase RusA-like endonuclease
MTLSRVELSIPGPPRGKQRVTPFNGRMIPSKETAAEEAYIRGLARRAMAERPAITGPVEITFEAVFDMPASWPPRIRAMRQLPHVSKPDLDNIEKLLLDACNGVIYADDAQICEVRKRKRYGEGARLDVTFQELATTSDHPAVKRAAKRAVEADTIAPRSRRKKPSRPAKPRAEPSIGKRLK